MTSEASRQAKRRRPRGVTYYLVIGFVVFHITAELIASTVEPIRGWFYPLIQFYADGLRMTDRWGMFSKPPHNFEIAVFGRKAGGEKVKFSTNYTAERKGLQRITDVRLRKLQTHLDDEGHRKNFVHYYLDHFCRSAQRDHPDLRSVRLIKIDAGKEQILASRRCRDDEATPSDRRRGGKARRRKSKLRRTEHGDP